MNTASTAIVKPTRRGFLKSSALTIGFSLSAATLSHGQTDPAKAAPAVPAVPAPPRAVLPGSLQTNRMLDGWLRINADATVTMFTGKVELGQGILTALTQVVSDELDVAIERIAVVSGDTARTPNEGITSGSLSIQDSGTALRFASAEARAILLDAAATRLGVPVADLRVNDGRILKAAGAGPDANTTETGLSYWGLTSDSLLRREASAKAAPKPVSAHRLIGQSVQRRDILGKVTGAQAYVHDLRLPGMVHGRIVRPSSPRAQLLALDTAAVSRMPGVLAVVRDGRFVAVAATREEQAIAAALVLQKIAKWSEPADLPPPGAALYDYLPKQRTQDSVVSLKPAAGAASASTTPTAGLKTLKAEYTKPYQAHGSIGPSCAVAQWTDGKLRVWCPSQGVFPLRGDLAKALRVPPASVNVIHAEGSGCYGQNGADDVALDAALLARALPGTPVRLQWSREDEFMWEPLGSPMLIKMQGSVDASGTVQDWNHELWSYTHSTRPGDADGVNLTAAWHIESPHPPGPARNIPQPSGGSDRNAVPLYDFAQQKVSNHLLLDMPIRTSALRTLGAYANVYAAESFMDELAAAAGMDAMAFRLKHLSDPRARAVLERTAALANWKQASPRDASKPVANTGVLKGQGIGFSKYKNLAVYCAVIAEVAVDTATGIVRVERAWSVADAGLVINPDGFRNQIEGGIIQSASWTLYEAIQHNTTHLLSKNWPDYPILRFSQMPAVQVELINRPQERPLGVGEGSQGPAAAAIGNAFANATGRRMRALPLTPDRVKLALG